LRRIEGGICAVEGVRAAAARRGKYGLALIAASGTAAGVFTTNKVRAAPVDVTALNLKGGRLDGVIANSGCANAYTGQEGFDDAQKMAEMFADLLGTDKSRIGIGSTGVIGRRLDFGLIGETFREAGAKLRNSPEASREAAMAIMTTDTVVKEVAVEHSGIRVAGISKGAGMIEPHMATMLCFLYTDADFPAEVLRQCLAEAVEDSFNMLIVDGDTSTNDTAVITATGKKRCDLQAFKEALSYVCTELAKIMARDGEGATKYFETFITGAKNDADARTAARAVARSSLVKTAVYGADPNWGRIVAAVGYSGAEMDPDILTLGLEGQGEKVLLVEKGKIRDGVLDKAKEIMAGDTILITVDLGLGSASARSFGCDLTEKYVDINAKYTT
jgi:glutamate N-acetyltransferase/amino-acid N-acetyltransferase